MFNGHDLVGYILFDIYRKMCDNGIDEFISMVNHVEKESLIYFIKCWIKTVGLERTKIIHILNWVLKGQWNWNHRILPWMIKGWDANLPVMLCLCGWYGQRSLCKPRKAQKREWAEREMPNAESDTGQEVLIFQEKKTTDLRLRFIHLLNPPIFREHFFCAGVRCSSLWLQTWKGRNELPHHACCVVIIPGLTSMLFANYFWSL